jgi:hypothetical protein
MSIQPRGDPQHNYGALPTTKCGHISTSRYLGEPLAYSALLRPEAQLQSAVNNKVPPLQQFQLFGENEASAKTD